MSGKQCFFDVLQKFLRFSDSQSALRPGGHHLRALPGALLDLLRRHVDWQGRHQDAHPEDVRHHSFQRDVDLNGLRMAEVRSSGGREAPGAIQGLLGRPEVETSQGVESRACARAREHSRRDFRKVRDCDGFVLCRVDSELVCSKLPQETAQAEREREEYKGLTMEED